MCCTFASQGIYLCFTAVKILKKVKRNKKFLQSRFFSLFFRLSSSLLKYKFYLSLQLKGSISQNRKKKFRVGFFLSSKSSIYWINKNIKLECFLSGNRGNFLILELESSIFWNMRNFFGMDFFLFELGLRSASVGPIIHY